MQINIKHADMKIKNSEWLAIVGLITSSAHEILTNLGYEQNVTLPLYIGTVVTKTGSAIYEKWERQGDSTDSS